MSQSHYKIDVTLTRVDVTSVDEQVTLRERQVELAEQQERIIAMHAPVEAVNQGSYPTLTKSIARVAQQELSPRDYKPVVEEVEVFAMTANANEVHHLTDKVTGMLTSYYNDDALAKELDGDLAHESGNADPEPESLADAMDLPEVEAKPARRGRPRGPAAKRAASNSSKRS